MKTNEYEELKNFKDLRWFVMYNKTYCTFCGNEFPKGDNSYMGYIDNKPAHLCSKCKENCDNAILYGNNRKQFLELPAPSMKLWRYMDFMKFVYLLETSSLFFCRIDHFRDSFEGALGLKSNEWKWEKVEMEWWMLFEKARYDNRGKSESEIERLH